MSIRPRIVLIGASGHGRVVADIVRAARAARLLGFLDDNSSKHGTAVGDVRVLGGIAELRNLKMGPRDGVIVSIGLNSVRMRVAAKIEALGVRLEVAVHPRAICAPDVRLNSGTVLMAGAIVNAAAVLGKNVIINTGATIDHECVISDGAHISPGANLAGNVHVGRLSHVGIGAVILPGISIGARCIVGAGSIVLRDVPAGCTVVGNPARIIARARRS